MFASLLLVAQWTSAQQKLSDDENQKSKFKLNLEITDESGIPIRGAEIEVLKWTGKLESIGVTGSTDDDGNVVLDIPHSDDSCDPEGRIMHNDQVNDSSDPMSF